MTKEELIRMAKEAGALQHVYDTNPPGYGPLMFDDAALERFASLVAAAEREACAQVCEEFAKDSDWPTADNCAAAIRARGKE